MSHEFISWFYFLHSIHDTQKKFTKRDSLLVNFLYVQIVIIFLIFS